MDFNILIPSAFAFLGTALASWSGFKLVAYRVKKLEEKVDEHNNFARRMPVVEKEIEVINHRIKDLEGKE